MPIVITSGACFDTNYVMGAFIGTDEGKKMLYIILNTGNQVGIELPAKANEKTVLKILSQYLFESDNILDLDDIISQIAENSQQIENELQKQVIIEKILEMPLDEIKEMKIQDLIK